MKGKEKQKKIRTKRESRASLDEPEAILDEIAEQWEELQEVWGQLTDQERETFKEHFNDLFEDKDFGTKAGDALFEEEVDDFKILRSESGFT